MTITSSARGCRRAHRPAALSVAALVAFAACSHGGTGRQTQQTAASTSTSTLPHPLPPGFAATNTPAVAAAPGALDVTELATVNLGSLHRAVLPAATQVNALTQAIVNKAQPTAVRPLLVDRIAPHPGQPITVVAGDLAATAGHDALFILQGPGGRYQRLVKVKSGIAAGLVTLPATMTDGVWALAVEDLSQLRVTRGRRPTGAVLLDLAVFTV